VGVVHIVCNSVYGWVLRVPRRAFPVKKKYYVHYNFTTFTETLSDDGKTADSALKIQLNIQTKENAVSNIEKHSGMAK